MVTGECYGRFFNAVAGGFGTNAGGQLLADTCIDFGPMLNAGMELCAASGLTALLLKS